MSRFYIYRNGLFFDYRRLEHRFINDHMDHKEWYLREEWWIRLGVERKMFGRTNMYYDGHTHKSFTLFGIEFGYGYGYDSRPLTEWTAKELATWRALPDEDESTRQ
jgi:hypothetical protein